MVLVHKDLLETLEATERQGALRSLKTVTRITGIEETDYSVLWESLHNAGIPLPGTTLYEYDNTWLLGRDLVLAERSVKIVDRDNGTADVFLNWEHVNAGPNLDLTLSNYVKVDASVHQDKTNFFLLASGERFPIRVQYTYPANDQLGRAGVQDSQTTVIDAFFPQANLKYSGYIDTNVPDLIEDAMLRRINITWFHGRPPRTVMCTKAAHHLISHGSLDQPTKQRHQFDFEFQYKDNGWQPTAIYIDPRTNQPPKDAVLGNGIRDLDYYKEIDFRAYLSGLQA
jgi:hypothetical protein